MGQSAVFSTLDIIFHLVPKTCVVGAMVVHPLTMRLKLAELKCISLGHMLRPKRWDWIPVCPPAKHLILTLTAH